MKKILMAIAVFAVIAAGSAVAAVQQLKGEEYASLDDLLKENMEDGEEVLEKLSVGEDHIVVLRNNSINTCRFLDVRKKNDNYQLKSESRHFQSSAILSFGVKYSKKEQAIVSLTPQEDGSYLCSMELVEK